MTHAVTAGLTEGGVGFPSGCLCGLEGCGAGVKHKWVEPGTSVAVRALSCSVTQSWCQLTLGWGQILGAYRTERDDSKMALPVLGSPW